MKILYFDCFAGAAGDMVLGALLDAGLPFDELQAALGSLAVGGWSVRADRVLRAGVTATKFRVTEHAALPAETAAAPARAHAHDTPHVHRHAGDRGHSHDHSHPHDHGHAHHHHGPAAADEDRVPHAHGAHHTLDEIRAAIDRSALTAAGKDRARDLFQRLAEAEASIHGTSLDRVHLHEVGALDSIIDIVGAVFALDWFKADRIVVSPINVGGGMVRSAHGLFPVPAPATVRLLGDAPIYSSGVEAELLTPTGALLLSGHASAYGPLPQMRVTAVGYGAGDREMPGTPNVLRVFVGQADDHAPAMRVAVLECEIDDMNPQLYGPLMDRLYAAGALEVCYTAVQMKKARPGTLVTIVARPDQRAAMADIMFRETTTIGIRYQELERECLDRTMIVVPTPHGDVRFKVASRAGTIVNAQPEFDDLARAAAERGLSVKEVQAAAWKAWLDR